MKVYERPELDLRLEQLDSGILVAQGGDEYVARRWRMTPSVMSAVELAFEYGFHWMILRGHPRENFRGRDNKGARYLCFSPDRNNRWVFVVGQQSPSNLKQRDDVARVVFQKKYRGPFTAAGVPFEVEKRNTQNLIVEREHLERALAAVAPVALEIGRSTVARPADGSYAGFLDEADIQRRLIDTWDRNPLGRELALLDQEHRVDNGRIDLLARDEESGAVVVVELKQQAAPASAVRAQLDRYVESDSVRSLAAHCGGAVWGCLIAEQIKEPVRELINESRYPLIAFEAAWREDGLSLTGVAGAWPAARG